MRISRVAVTVLLAFITASSLSAAEDEKARLLRADREWAQAASEGKDVDRIVSFWSDDAVVYPAGEPVVRGKQAIRAFVTQSLAIPGFKIGWRTDDASISGDMGYLTGENTMTVPGADGKPMTMKSRAVSIWRRSPNGEWKCVVDIWNSGP